MLKKIKNILNSRIVRNAGWLVCGAMANKAIAFIVGIFTARYLGPGNYGLINYSAAYTTFFYSFATLGINSVIINKIIDNPDREGAMLGTTLILQMIASLLSIIMILCIVCVVDYGEKITIAVVFLYSIGLLFQIVDSFKYWFHSKLKSKYIAIATTIAYIASSVYKIILLVLGKPVTWFALAATVDYFCVAVVLIIAYKHNNGPKLSFSFAAAKDLLGSSRYYILTGLMISLYGITDKLMLKQMLNEEAVGFYGTAVAISNVWVFVLGSIIDSMNPVIVEAHKNNYKEYVKKNMQLYRIIFYLSCAVSFAVTVFAKYGIDILYGPAYSGAIMPLRIVTWYVVFSYLGVARGIWVISEGKQKHLTPIYIMSAITNIVLNAMLIPSFGASGAAFASLITQVCTVFVAPLFFSDMRVNVKMMLDAIFFKKIKEN